MKKYIQYLLVCSIFISCSQPEVKIDQIRQINIESSTRGLFCISNNVTWVSGTNGFVGVFNNDSLHHFIRNEKLDELDFRDIHAFNDEEAIIMSSGDGCVIYKTSDGTKTWTLVYENNGEGIFFDGMDFWDKKHGVAFSDPINNRLYIIETKDGGDSWQKLESIELPKTLKGEAGFAASGTGIECVGDSTVYIGTGGGKTARVFISYNRGISWKVVNTPMRPGEASGIYSLTFLDEKNGVAVGGNYLDSVSTEGNCAITKDGGLTWQLPKTPPTGYMSCVAHNGEGILICTGRNGIDVSYDKGNNWTHITDDAYYSCVIQGSTGWLTGRGGKVAKITID
ncbi:MAG: hypothetical protein JKX68_12875 [Flavobacteriales bacterium]|nr:hypothetical protein [Flavobacteriales bacterium]